ncbi:hypothetical protein ACLI4Y_13205 [Natrialbaceae archaeon A-CW3]
MALYDIYRDDTVWVNTVGYGDEIHSRLEELQCGNVIKATVTDAMNKNEYGDLRDVQIVEETLLYYFLTDGYAPGPTDELWERKPPDADVMTAAMRSDTDDKVLYEIQVQAAEVEHDGEIHNVFTDLQRGELLTEPFFEGTGCDYLEDGVEVVFVAKPERKPYLVMYLFPHQNHKYNQIYNGLYEYLWIGT